MLPKKVFDMVSSNSDFVLLLKYEKYQSSNSQQICFHALHLY